MSRHLTGSHQEVAVEGLKVVLGTFELLHIRTSQTVAVTSQEMTSHQGK